jgi:hypothetical protein
MRVDFLSAKLQLCSSPLNIHLSACIFTTGVISHSLSVPVVEPATLCPNSTGVDTANGTLETCFELFAMGLNCTAFNCCTDPAVPSGSSLRAAEHPLAKAILSMVLRPSSG